MALLRTFFNRLHGYHIQYNVVSRETLIDAQNILKSTATSLSVLPATQLSSMCSQKQPKMTLLNVRNTRFRKKNTYGIHVRHSRFRSY